MSRTQRIGVPVVLVLVFSAIVALVFSDSWTVSNITRDLVVVVTGPFHAGWSQVRSTGPVRRAAVVLLFVIVPILLLPVYSLKPGARGAVITAIGALLWVASGFLMMALQYAD